LVPVPIKNDNKASPYYSFLWRNIDITDTYCGKATYANAYIFNYFAAYIGTDFNIFIYIFYKKNKIPSFFREIFKKLLIKRFKLYMVSVAIFIARRLGEPLPALMSSPFM